MLAAPALSAPSCPKPPALPETFVSQIDNPYLPLKPGTTLTYKGKLDGQPATDVFSVTSRTKVILGVATTVIHDQVIVKGDLVEDTEDWFAQDSTGAPAHLQGFKAWPREESNLRTQIRSLPLCPLSYGAGCEPSVARGRHHALAGAWSSRSAGSPRRSSRLRSASAFTSAPKRRASADSQSQVSMMMTAANVPHVLL